MRMCLTGSLSRTSLCVISGRCYSPIDAQALAGRANNASLPPAACSRRTASATRPRPTLRPGPGFTPLSFPACATCRRGKHRSRSEVSGQPSALGQTPDAGDELRPNNSQSNCLGRNNRSYLLFRQRRVRCSNRGEQDSHARSG
jgi:hypothetical protein